MSETRGRWQEEHGYFFRGSPTDPQWLELDYLNALERDCDELRAKAEFLATVMGFLTSLRDDSDEAFAEPYFTQRAHELCLEYASLIQEGK